MDKRSRAQLALGFLLVLVAGWLVMNQVKPDWMDWLHIQFEWPMWVILSGAALLVIGLATGNPDMAVPAFIVSGVGGILYYQNNSGDWSSWSYLWAILPGLGGLGHLVSALISGNLKSEGRQAVSTIFVSLVLFIIFAAMFGGLDILGTYKNYILIGLLFIFGLWLILRGIFRKR